MPPFICRAVRGADRRQRLLGSEDPRFIGLSRGRGGCGAPSHCGIRRVGSGHSFIWACLPSRKTQRWRSLRPGVFAFRPPGPFRPLDAAKTSDCVLSQSPPSAPSVPSIASLRLGWGTLFGWFYRLNSWRPNASYYHCWASPFFFPAGLCDASARGS